MPNRKPTAQQQFSAVEDLLTAWLKERREVLARYTEIVVATDIGPDPADLAARQRLFCAVLVDYISAGHFEVFKGLLDEAEAFGDNSAALARDLIPRIGDTTEVILAYDEKYSQATQQTGSLERDLSALGEVCTLNRPGRRCGIDRLQPVRRAHRNCCS